MFEKRDNIDLEENVLPLETVLAAFHHRNEFAISTQIKNYLSEEKFSPFCEYSILITQLRLHERKKIKLSVRESDELKQIFHHATHEIKECKTTQKRHRYQVVMGLAHEYGLLDSSTLANAINYYEAAAKENCAEALNSVGCVLLKTFPDDKTLATKLFKKSAEQECADAKHNLAILQSSLKISAFKKAANRGCAHAINHMGLLSQKENRHYAVRCFQTAAMRGDVSALTNLGIAYQQGWGVFCNFSSAFSCYEAASLCGDDVAYHNLGALCYAGKGIAKSYSLAAYYFRLALLVENSFSRQKSLILLLESTILHPVFAVTYHAVFAFDNKKLLQEAFQSNPKEFNEMCLQDCSNEKIKNQTTSIMRAFLLNHSLDKHNPFLNDLYFYFGMDAMEKNEREIGISLLARCVPQLLSAERNFEIAFHLYPEEDMEVFYSFLREAILKGNKMAFHFFKNILQSRLSDGLQLSEELVEQKLAPTFKEQVLMTVNHLFFKRSGDRVESTRLTRIVENYCGMSI